MKENLKIILKKEQEKIKLENKQIRYKIKVEFNKLSTEEKIIEKQKI